MTPEQVTATAARLKDAMARDDGEEDGMAAVLELVAGAALNLARIAQHLGEPK